MQKLKKALQERTKTDEVKGLRLSERLEKAKYLKRTGGPGHYKYSYGEDRSTRAYKQQQTKELMSHKGFPKEYAGALKYLSGPQISYIKLHIDKGWKIPRIKANDKGIANALIYERGTTDKQFIAAARRSEQSLERRGLKEAKEKKVEAKPSAAKEDEGEDYSEWDEGELTQELYESFEDQERTNYVAKKLKMPPAEVEDDDIQKYLAGMGKEKLIKEIKKRMR